MVYVLSNKGQALMPCKPAKARHLLQKNRARVVRRIPFTIQLKFECENVVQLMSLGVDAGSKKIGLSVTTEQRVYYESEVELRNDVVELISTRREARKVRRNRKTRYRKPRFNNRANSRRKGRLAPSVQQKIDTHKTSIYNIYKLVPLKKIRVEVASFDIQKIKNPEISGEEYQQGDQYNYFNVREYVFCRDGFKCQCCRGKSGDKHLNLHHKESRKTGGDAPGNLITLCETCHKRLHAGEIKLPKEVSNRSENFRDAAFMNTMRWKLYEQLKEFYKDKGIEVEFTFGYITSLLRKENNLPKEHYIDARCISGNPQAIPMEEVVVLQKKVRRHNRKVYKDKILKGGIRKRNQCSYEIYGYHRYDLVEYEDRICYVNGLRISGQFQIKDLQDFSWKKELSYKKLKRIQQRGGYIQSIKRVV